MATPPVFLPGESQGWGYCNIPMHRTWPVLFIVSAVLNVVLIVVLIYVIMRKRNTYDDTPLVSYDIDDDMDY